MMQQKPPVTYEDWLNELNNQTKLDDIVRCAVEAARRAPNNKLAFHDVSLVLANMYDRQIKLAAGNQFVIRNVNKKFDTVCTQLFKMPMSKVRERVIQNEPDFDRQASGAGGLGYVDPPKGKGGLGYLEN